MIKIMIYSYRYVHHLNIQILSTYQETAKIPSVPLRNLGVLSRFRPPPSDFPPTSLDSIAVSLSFTRAYALLLYKTWYPAETPSAYLLLFYLESFSSLKGKSLYLALPSVESRSWFGNILEEQNLHQVFVSFISCDLQLSWVTTWSPNRRSIQLLKKADESGRTSSCQRTRKTITSKIDLGVANWFKVSSNIAC